MIRGDNETVRERLKNYRSLVLKYEAYQMIYDQLYPRITPVLSDVPKGQPEGNALEKLVERRIDLREKIIEIQSKMRDEIDEIMRMIGTLKDDEQTIIIFRYINGMSWKKINRKMNYSERQCYYIHNRAIENMNVKGLWMIN